MFTNLRDFYERNKDKRVLKYGAPAAILVSIYYLWLPDNYKLQFTKRIKEDKSVREYGGKDE